MKQSTTPLFDDQQATPGKADGQTEVSLEKLIQQVPRLQADYQLWNLQGALPQDSIMIFVDQEHMPQFAPFAGKRHKTIKLANYGKPAIQITLFLTHRYELKKADRLPRAIQQKNISRVARLIRSQIQEVSAKRGDKPGDQSEIARLKQLFSTWQQYAASPDDYEVAISNYERHYLYHTLNYKYRLSDPTADYEFANKTVHLIKTQTDPKTEETLTRYNIVFVDQTGLCAQAPYQNKTIHKYLATFADKYPINDGKDIVYIRPKRA